MTKFEFYGKTIATYDAETREINVAGHGWLCDADTVEEARAIVKRYMKTRLHSGAAY